MSTKARRPVPASSMELKGHLNLKSSAYCTKGGKLCDQYLAVDQMNAHYKKVLTAKSAIDNKVPKSHTSSTLVRDRQKRAAILKSGSRPPTRSSLRQMGGSRENLNTQSMFGSRTSLGSDKVMRELRTQEEEEMAFVDNIINDTINSPRSYCGEEGETGWAKRVTISTRKPPTTPRKQSADVLDKRCHKFTEPVKPFTPRTLKKDNVVSRLSQSKSYRPPPKKVGELKLTSGVESKSTSGGHSEPDMAIENGSIFDETLMSRDFNRLKKTGTVPALDISLDTDNLKWMKEQSFKDKSRRPHSRKYESSKLAQKPLMEEPRQRSIVDEDEMKLDTYRWVQSNGYSDRNTLKNTDNLRASSRGGYNKSMTMQRVEDEEEELKYLDFVTEVTNDVLSRGIFTNRVLKVVFKQHMDKHKNDLSQSRMKALLDTLREDLGIPQDDEDVDTTDNVGMSTSKSYNKKLREYDQSLDSTWTRPKKEMSSPQKSYSYGGLSDELGDSSSTAKLDSLVRQELLEDANQNYKHDKYGASKHNNLENIEELSFDNYSDMGSVKSAKGSVKSRKSVQSVKSSKSYTIVTEDVLEAPTPSPRPVPAKRRPTRVRDVEKKVTEMKISALDSDEDELSTQDRGDNYDVASKSSKTSVSKKNNLKTDESDEDLGAGEGETHRSDDDNQESVVKTAATARYSDDEDEETARTDRSLNKDSGSEDKAAKNEKSYKRAKSLDVDSGDDEVAKITTRSKTLLESDDEDLVTARTEDSGDNGDETSRTKPDTGRDDDYSDAFSDEDF